MSKPKFTPGPWDFKTYTNVQKNWTYMHIESASKRQIAKMHEHIGDCRIGENLSEEDKANAHLISAAPEMFALLERFQELAIEFGDFNELVEEADKVLAKARGES